jgi:hypothetical protein
MTSRNKSTRKINRVVLHAADLMCRDNARHDADSHAETVEQLAIGKAY